MRGVIWIVMPLALSACEGPPAQIVVRASDTVLVNSRAPVQLPVQVLDDAGRELRPSGVRFESRSDDSIRVSGLGRVTCTRRGSAEVRVTLGDLSTRLHVLCRPVKGFTSYPPPTPPLVAGGPPQALTFGAVGVDGEPVTILAGRLVVEDTQVAAVHDQMIVPNAPGFTTIELDLGHCVLGIEVEVHERVAEPLELRNRQQLFALYPLRLADGEERSWRIHPGEYRIGLAPDTGQDARLQLATTAMNCVRDPGVAQDLHCAALPGASVSVRNPRSAGGGGTLGGDFFINRWDESLSDAKVPAPRPRSRQRSRTPFCRPV
jgi:hypothetical protein